MKQKDLALILIIAAVTAVVSFLISGWTFGRPANKQQQAEVVDVISPDFTLPSQKYFNVNSIDPTQLIQIDNNNNSNPFGKTQ